MESKWGVAVYTKLRHLPNILSAVEKRAIRKAKYIHDSYMGK